MTIAERILAACIHGATMREIHERIMVPNQAMARSKVGRQVTLGNLFRVGPAGHQVYFTDQAEAERYAESRKAEWDAILAFRSLPKKERVRLHEEKRRAAMPPKPPKPAKPVKYETPKIAIPAPVTVKSKRDLPVVIPPHVKVQVCPTGVDDRFTFTPPSPNWRGQISKDWQERRQQEQRK